MRPLRLVKAAKGRLRPCIQSKLFFFIRVVQQATQVIQKRPGVDSFPTITSLIQAEFFGWQGFDGGTLQKLPIRRDASSFLSHSHPQEESAHEPPLQFGFQSGLSPDREAFANPDPPTD